MNWRRPIIHLLLRASGSRIPDCLKAIARYESMSRDEVAVMQRELLAGVLQHAHGHVPYYRRMLADHGVVTPDAVNLEAFERLPLLTKAVIRREGEAMHADDAAVRKSYENTSGGSTGEPVTFLQDRHYDDWNVATKLYFNEVLGKREGEPEVKLWGSDRDILEGNLTWKDRLINRLYNRRFFNSYRLGEPELRDLVALNNRFRPKAYWAYMESALELARYIRRTGAAFHSPAFVISTIGPLTSETRDAIEDGMGCKAYNQYGSREVGAIACQCRRQEDMHLFPWWNLVEVLDEEGRPVWDREGRIVVTTLRNKSMPLIRYEIGDVGIATRRVCPCGRSTTALRSVLGRTLGYFKLGDGTLVHSHFIVQALFFREWIKRFQVVQKDFDHVEIRVEKSDAAEVPAADIEDIRQKTRVLMGSQCRVDVVFADSIRRSPSGKYLYTVCELS